MSKKGLPPVAPEPVTRFGNRDLFTEAQAPEYISKLVKLPKTDPATMPLSTSQENSGGTDAGIKSRVAPNVRSRQGQTSPKRERGAGFQLDRSHDR